MPTPKEGYFLANGDPVPGTTTILGRFKESGGLLFWAHGIGYEQGRAGKKAQLYEKRDEAADVGTYVHDMVYAQLHGAETPPIPTQFTPEMREQAANGLENYMREMKRTKAFIMPWEKPLVSEAHRYGGTPDGLIECEDIVDLGDWKTGVRAYTDYIIQGAAYRQLVHECTTITIRGLRIYMFSKEAGRFTETYFGADILDLAFKQFLLFREAWDYDKKLKKLV